jgi:ubiquitin C-terminal hydrolase
MQVHVDELSEYAIVQFLRFEHGKFGTTKDNRSIDYPSEFDSATLLNPTHPTGEYSLVAVIRHLGDVQGGHYTYVVRRSVSSPWHEILDSQVSEGSTKCWFCNDAYILFYERQG